jgi:prophage regulatory protein
MHTILRLPDVKRSTGLSHSTICLRITQGTFPKPVSLGAPWAGWKPRFRNGYSDELKGAAVKATVARGQFWGHGPIFKLRIARLDEHLQ